jgi:hypothetical protein
MERDRQVEAARDQEEVLVEAGKVREGWEEHAPGRDPVAIVSAPLAERVFRIRGESHVII